MIRMLFKSFFKRFLGLFVSMTFVSLLAIGLLVTFGSTLINLDERYTSYLKEYGNVDLQVDTSLASREDLNGVLQAVPGIKKADVRFSLDTYLKKSTSPTEKTLTARIFSYNEPENDIFKRYVLSSTEPNYEKMPDGSFKYMNAGITRKFAKNNSITLGQTLVIGYQDVYVDVYINEIVETAEGIYPRANEYIWSDNQGFGYLYVDEKEFGKGITNLSNKIIARIESETTEEAKDTIRKIFVGLIELMGLPNFLDPSIDSNYVSAFGNQIIIQNKEGYTQDEAKTAVEEYLASEVISVRKSLTGETLPYKVYMANAQRQLTVGAIFLPVFFYSVTMIIIGLFMNQIIKNMTSDMGIMMSIGVGKWDIISLFLLFAFVISMTAGLIGSFVGYGLNIFMTSIMTETYSIPTLVSSINPLVLAGAIVGLTIFAELATFLSCLAIFKITPKDAVISNESKRKKNPKWVERLIDKSPMSVKLGLNSIFQNPKRFFVSSFSIFASFVLIMLCCNFYVSKETMISQSVDQRLNYDCQVYMQEVSDQALIDEIKALPSVDKFEDCYYTYLKAEKGDRSVYIETLGINEASNSGLIAIPDINGTGSLSVPAEGIILPKSDAIVLGVNVGDIITVGGLQVKVANISYQYFHPISYLSKTQMEAIGKASELSKYVSSFIANLNDKEAFEDYFTSNSIQCLKVYTSNLSKDLHGIFDAINVMIFIMIGFAFGIGFIILAIMSQNSLMEQQRSVSVLRLIGFTVGDISTVWSLQSILQMIASSIVAIPAGIGASILLFSLASGKNQIYPFIFSWPVLGISFAFILLSVLLCHVYSMISIRKWNLADNTRSRE